MKQKKTIFRQRDGQLRHGSPHRRFLQLRLLLPLGILAAAGVLNLLAHTSKAFANGFLTRVFPFAATTYGRFSGLFPFSLGEILLVAAVVLAVLLLVLIIFRIIFVITRRVFRAHADSSARQNKSGRNSSGEPPTTSARFPLLRTAILRLSFFVLWAFAVTILVLTLNCFVIYQADGLPLPAPTEAKAEECYSVESLTALRDALVTEANTLAVKVPRDETGRILFDADLSGGANDDGANDTAAADASAVQSRPAGSASSDGADGTAHADDAAIAPGAAVLPTAAQMSYLRAESIRCMQALGAEYPLLAGWYPHAKPMLFSWVMCQTNMMGYYFPFSMEANYNDLMCEMKYPGTLTHELAHLKGYMREDDCNMLAFLACRKSGDIAFRYGGVLSVLYYVDNAFWSAIGKDADAYAAHPQISDLVRADNQYLPNGTLERIEAWSPLDTKKSTAVNHTVSDASMKANGIREGRQSYSLVVRHLLAWWYETGGRL